MSSQAPGALGCKTVLSHTVSEPWNLLVGPINGRDDSESFTSLDFEGLWIEKLWTLRRAVQMDPGKHHIRLVGVRLELFIKIGLAEALGIRYTVSRKGILSSRDLKEMSVTEVGKLGVFSDFCCYSRNF